MTFYDIVTATDVVFVIRNEINKGSIDKAQKIKQRLLEEAEKLHQVGYLLLTQSNLIDQFQVLKGTITTSYLGRDSDNGNRMGGGDNTGQNNYHAITFFFKEK